jgi:hypothetical protein
MNLLSPVYSGVDSLFGGMGASPSDVIPFPSCWRCQPWVSHDLEGKDEEQATQDVLSGRPHGIPVPSHLLERHSLLRGSVHQYGTMSPIITWFTAGCLFVMQIAYKHNYMYNYSKTPDSGGLLWLMFIRLVQVSVLIGEFLLLGYLILKKATVAWPLMIPIIVGTLLHTKVIVFVTCKKTSTRLAIL